MHIQFLFRPPRMLLGLALALVCGAAISVPQAQTAFPGTNGIAF